MNTTFTLRRGTPSDVDACAAICYEAFGGINHRHGFAPDFPDSSMATDLMKMLLTHEGIYSVVAEQNGTVVGSNFLFHGTIGGIGPITVDPKI